MGPPLEAAGLAVYTQKGSHVKFVREEADGLRVVIVPARREIAVMRGSGRAHSSSLRSLG